MKLPKGFKPSTLKWKVLETLDVKTDTKTPCLFKVSSSKDEEFPYIIVFIWEDPSKSGVCYQKSAALALDSRLIKYVDGEFMEATNIPENITLAVLIEENKKLQSRVIL